MRSLLLLLVVLSGCAPTLYVTRPTAPEATLGPVRTVSVEASSNMGQSVGDAVVKGLFMGTISVPIATHTAVANKVKSRLAQLGYQVCEPGPCGDGVFHVNVLESAVDNQLTSSGPRARVFIKARMFVTLPDGQIPFDYNFWDTRYGSSGQAGQLVDAVANTLATRFANTLLPGSERVEFPLDDGGDLSPGVNMLMSSNWDGAIAYFTDLTQKQPDLAGAWYDLGVAHEVKNEWPQALNAYEQAAARSRKQYYLQAVSTARANQPAPTVQPIPLDAQPAPDAQPPSDAPPPAPQP